MGHYVVRVAEEYYDDECDWRGYPVKKIRYTGEEYETTVEPEDSVDCHVMSDGYTEAHTVIGGGCSRTLWDHRWDKEDVQGDFVFSKDSKRTVLIDCTNKYIKRAVIPNTVKRVEGLAFDECFDLETIVIPESVESFSDLALVGVRQSGEIYHHVKVTFSEGVKKIRKHALPQNTDYRYMSGRTYLVGSVDIPDTVKEIEEKAFCSLRLFEVTIPDSIKKMGVGVFFNSEIFHMTISDSSWQVFKKCILEGIKLAWTVSYETKLLYYGFYELPKVAALEKYTTIGDGAFENSPCGDIEKLVERRSIWHDSRDYVLRNMTTLVIPYNIQSIGNFAFRGCSSLFVVRLPDSVTYIGDEAFKDCVNLKEINIPRNVTWLGDHTFDGCSSLHIVLLRRELYNNSRQKFPENTEFMFYEDFLY